MTSPVGSPAPGLWRRRRGDLFAAVVIVLIPLLWFGIPAAAGHPVMPGDDLMQNYPLRVLVGRQLRHGTLPVYNPYIWSGAPLLGGWNAGALYPFTFLFAFLPSNLAWTANEVIVYSVGGLGLYALLRTFGLRPVSSALGASAFVFAGAMDVHLVHFGLVAGTSWGPVVLLALVKLARARGLTGRLLWTTALAVAGALVVLAGEPRAIDTVLIVTAIFLVWLAIREARPVLPFLLGAGTGFLLAALISAVQWLPGAMAVSTSQRAAVTYALFGTGSLQPRWLLLILVPGLLGGTGSFGTATWLAGYNLPEVMGYVGLLAVAGAFGLLGTLRRHQRLPDWFVWIVVAVVGVLLALGSYTPLGHVLAGVPLFGSQRLQSRNIALTDLALAALAAYWVDFLLDWRSPAERPATTPNVVRRAMTAALVPISLAGVMAVVGSVSPATIAELAGADSHLVAQAGSQRPVFLVSALLCAGAFVLVARSSLMTPGRLAWLLVGFATVDLLLFNLTSVWSIATSPPQVATSSVATVTPGTAPVPLSAPVSLGTTGRFVFYDPLETHQGALAALGQPDLNLLDETFSAQGYSAIVDGHYAALTGAHAASGQGTNALDPSAIDNGVLDSLGTTTLVTSPEYLVTPVPPGTALPTPAVGTGTGRRSVAAGGTARWVFGEQIEVSSVSVPWSARSRDQAGTPTLRVALQKPDGRLEWQLPTVERAGSGMLDIELAGPAPGIGLVIESGTTGTFEAPVVHTGRGASYEAVGDLQDALSDGHWNLQGNRGQLAVFANDNAAAPLTLRGMGGVGVDGATVRANSGPRLAPTSATVSSPHGVEVLRSVAAIPGWSATWRPSGTTATVALTVHRSGVVQSVDVPAGRGLLTWNYDAPGLTAGAWCAAAGALTIACLWLGLAVGRSRRSRTRSAPGAEDLGVADLMSDDAQRV
jgi:hypothetical protein